MKVSILVYHGRFGAVNILGVFAKRSDADKAFEQDFIYTYSECRHYRHELWVSSDVTVIDFGDESIAWCIYEEEVQR